MGSHSPPTLAHDDVRRDKDTEEECLEANAGQIVGECKQWHRGMFSGGDAQWEEVKTKCIADVCELRECSSTYLSNYNNIDELIATASTYRWQEACERLQ